MKDIEIYILETNGFPHLKRQEGFEFVLLIELPSDDFLIEINLVIRTFQAFIVNFLLMSNELHQLLSEVLGGVLNLNHHAIIIISLTHWITSSYLSGPL